MSSPSVTINKWVNSSQLTFKNFVHNITANPTANKWVDSSCVTFKNFIHNVTRIRDNPTALRYGWEAVSNVFIALANWRSELLRTPVGKTIAVVDATQCLIDANDYLSGKFDNVDWKNTAQRTYIAQRLAFAVSNLTFAASWLIELGFVAASAAATAAIGTVCSASAAIAFGIGSASAAWTLTHLSNHVYKKEVTIKALLDLIGLTAATAIPTLATLGVTIGTIPLALLTLTATSFILASFVYQKNHEKELESLNGEPECKEPRRITLLTGLAQIFEDSESLEKFCKLTGKLLEGVKDVACIALVSTAKSFVELHEATLLPKRIKEWTVDKFWARDAKGNRKSSNWKIGNKFFQTIKALTDACSFAIKYKFFELAVLTSITIGNIPLLTLSALGSVTAFSICGLVESSLTYNNWLRKNKVAGQLTVAEEKVKAEKQYQKWRTRVEKIDDKEVLMKIRGSRSRSFDKAATNLERHSLMKLSNAKFAEQKLAQKTVRLENVQIKCNKLMISMANDSFKTTGCTLALASLALAGSTIAPPALAVISGGAAGFGIISACTGLLKPWYEKKYPSLKPVPALIPAF